MRRALSPRAGLAAAGLLLAADPVAAQSIGRPGVSVPGGATAQISPSGGAVGTVVNAAGAPAGSTYQWFRGTVSTPISGATSATYTTQSTDGGQNVGIEIALPAVAIMSAAPSTYVGLITDHQGLPNSTVSGAQYVNFDSGEVLLQQITTGRVKVAIWNAYGAIGSSTGNEASAGAVTDVQASFRIGSLCYQATFSGSTDGTIGSPGIIVSDWITVPNEPAGTSVGIRGFVHAPSGYVYYAVTGASSRDVGNFSTSSQSSLVGSGQGVACPTITSNTTNAQFITAGAYSDTSAPSVFVLGDSREAALGIPTPNTMNLGDIQGNLVAQKPSLPILNPSIPSRRASQFLANNPAEIALLPYFSDVISELGYNDMDSGAQTASQTEASLAAIFATLSMSQHVIQSKLFYKTTSTDGYVTTANQSAYSKTGVTPGGTGMAQFNADVAAGLITGDNNGYIDPLVTIEPTNVYRLGPNARSPNDCGMSSGSNVLTSASANFTAADIGFGNSIAGVGGGGTTATGNLISGDTSATQVTLGQKATTFASPFPSANASTSATSQVCTVAAAIVQPDGIHLWPGGINMLINAGSGYIPLSKIHYP